MAVNGSISSSSSTCLFALTVIRVSLKFALSRNTIRCLASIKNKLGPFVAKSRNKTSFSHGNKYGS